MNKQTINDEIEKLSEKAQALVTDTVTIAGDEMGKAREGLAAALNRGREIYDQIRSKEMEGTCAVKKAMNEHAVKAIAISIGIGALIGFFTSRRCPAKCE